MEPRFPGLDQGRGCCGYPPGTFSKGLYTDFASLRRKVNQGEQLAETMRARLERDPLWGPAGREMKCVVSREFSDQEIVGVMGYLTDLRAAIVEQGLAVAFGQESESTE